MKIDRGNQPSARQAGTGINNQYGQGWKPVLITPIHDMPKLGGKNPSSSIAKPISKYSVRYCFSLFSEANENLIYLKRSIRVFLDIAEILNRHAHPQNGNQP